RRRARRMSDEAQLEAIRHLLRLAERYRLAELEVEENGLKVTIRGPEGAGAPVVEAVRSAHPAASGPGAAAHAERPEPDNYHILVSPVTGTFYRAPDPEMPPYVEIGQQVEEGQTVGVIEAMKVFSDVPSDCAGMVVEFRAANGQLVQQGDPLLIIELPA